MNLKQLKNINQCLGYSHDKLCFLKCDPQNFGLGSRYCHSRHSFSEALALSVAFHIYFRSLLYLVTQFLASILQIKKCTTIFVYYYVYYHPRHICVIRCIVRQLVKDACQAFWILLKTEFHISLISERISPL